MEIRHLRLIETVANEGNLSKAVSKLHVSASALSHQLKDLESELGVSLFHRVNKKLILTDAGNILLQSAKKILKELEIAEKSIGKLRDGQTGEIRISTECYTCYHWLPGVMNCFHREFPQVELSIHPEFTNNPFQPLLDGEVDAVITSSVNEYPSLEFRELFRDELLAVVPKGHPWEAKPFVEAADFSTENVIIYGKPLETVSVFSHLLIPNQIQPRKVTELQLTEAQLEMVKIGYGVKVIAKWAIAPYLKNQPIAAVPITKNGLYRTWYLALLKREKQPEYYEAFIRMLIQQLRV